jgi:CBS domain containing-hemolysin-like protein
MNELATILWTAGAVACLAWSAGCSGTEMGCYAVNRIRLDLRASRAAPVDRAARTLYRELQRPDRNLVTLLISNNIANYLMAVCTTAAMLSAGLTPQQTGVIGTVVLAPLTLVLGEALPKEVFRANADRMVYALALPLKWSRLALTAVGIHPLVRLVSRLAERLSGIRPDAVSDARQRVTLLVREGVGAGFLSTAQASLADRALVFGRVRVSDEMTPWSLVRSIPEDADHASAVRIASLSKRSRLPMTDATGRVIGVVRSMDVFIHPGVQPAALARPVPQVPPEMPARDALLALRDSPMGVAVVRDASGKPLGLVTAKDLVEPLTGELPDL